MKRREIAKASLAAAVIAALSSVAGASTGTWSASPADANWNNNANWSGATFPNNTNESATFSNALSGDIGSASNPISLSAGVNFQNLAFTGNAGAYVIGSNNGPTLTARGVALGSTLNTISVAANVVNSQIIAAPLAFSAPSSTTIGYIIKNDATLSSTTLTLSGAIQTNPGTTRTGTLYLEGSNSGENTISGVITSNLTPDQGPTLVKNGTGTWVLTAANQIGGGNATDTTGTRGIQVNAGVLSLRNNAALGTTAGIQTYVNGGILDLATGITLDNGVKLNLMNGGTIRSTGSNATNGGISIGTAAGTSVTISTASAADVFTIGNATNEFTGGLADSVVHLAGGGTFVIGSSSNYVGTVTFDSAGTLSLGGTHSFANLSGTGTVQNAGATSGTLVTSVSSGASKTISSTLQNSGVGGTLSLTKNGLGTLKLTGPVNYTGTTLINAGILNVDLSGTAVVNNAIGAVTMAGTKQQIIGAAAGSTLTSTSTAVTAGYNVISAAPLSGGTNPTVNLGTISGVAGSALRIDGAAYNSGASSGTTTGGNTVAAVANYTGSGTTVGGGLLSYSTSTGTAAGAYATVGLYDWAALSSGTVVGGSQVSGFYSTLSGSLPTGFVGINLDLTASATMASNTTSVSTAYATVRFNANAAVTLTGARALAANNVGGILVTPNVGANNVTINNGSGSVHWQATRSTNSATGWTVWQNNTAGELIINAQYDNGTNSGATDSYTQAGDGTVRLNGVNGYTGQTYLLGGTTIITAYSGLGGGSAPTTLAQVNLNGGTLVGNASTASTDFSGAVVRSIVLGTNGGAMAATTGNTLSSAGVVSGAGTLNIGTGSIAGGGLLTGNGTVVLSNANSYSGGTVLNAGTLDFNGVFALGGANYGGTRFNGGTLRWASSFPGTNGTSDISIVTANGNAAVYLDTNGGTMNTNGNNVSFANGVSGIGALTKTGNGSLTMAGANTYSGATNVNGGSLVVNGSHTGAGAYLVNSGATLSGGGSIATAGNAGITVNNGGKFAPGGASAGTMTLNLGSGSVDISGAVTNSNSQSLMFRIGAASDKVVVTGGLNIGSGVLELDDLALTDVGGVQTGSYTLIDSSAGITGTLGTNLSGTFGSGVTASLALSQDNTDLLLNVTSAPEPSSIALLGLGAIGLLQRRRRAK